MCGNTQMRLFLTCNEFYCPHTHGLPASGDCGTRRIAPASACCEAAVKVNTNTPSQKKCRSRKVIDWRMSRMVSTVTRIFV